MERLTAIFILFVIPFIVVGCAVKKQKKSARVPASISSSPMSEAERFMDEIENAPSARY